MRGKAKPPIPEPIVQLQRQLDQFRSTQPRRSRLPESLWEAAVELARQHGVYSRIRVYTRWGHREITGIANEANGDARLLGSARGGSATLSTAETGSRDAVG